MTFIFYQMKNSLNPVDELICFVITLNFEILFVVHGFERTDEQFFSVKFRKEIFEPHLIMGWLVG